MLNETFRFFDVDPDTLVSSFFRLRLFADISVDAEYCIGEMIVELIGLLDCEQGFQIWKEFQRKEVIRAKKTEPSHSDDDVNRHQ